ncbi:hypothetical protein Nit79A3_2195 [Nitrosomonas sp. Is79A3]|uniref:hypothetical protein n=1 Tax=Nitrosomonas sp. (strain Is79A3) TaxID=261292 RepID=UPI000215D3E6
MSEQNKSEDKSSHTTPTIAVIALLLGFFATQGTIFNPTRPAMNNTERAVTEDVRARLWEDPFQAVEQHRKQNNNEKTEIIFTDQSGRTYQDEAGSIQEICRSHLHNKTTLHSIEELGCQIYHKTDEGKSLHILAVMVSNRPYAENQEWRLRNRYALISGLSAAGYNPIDSEHIGFIDFEKACRKNKDYCDFPDYTPYEWFELDKSKSTNDIADDSAIMQKLELKSSDKKELVLVLWLNNDILAHNTNSIKILSQLKTGIKSNSKSTASINFNVIGPHDSDTLKGMYTEAHDLNKIWKNLPLIHKQEYYRFARSNIFSPFVTAEDNQLIPSKTKIVNANWIDEPPANLSQWLQSNIIRTINTNDQLVDILLCELALRGVTLYEKEKCGVKPEFVLEKPAQTTHHIVLINELDTFDSQSLLTTLLKEINPDSGQSHKEKSSRVHTFSYLRGLDGITTAGAFNNQASKIKDQGSSVNKQVSKETIEQRERPVGPSQLDYLLRLAEEIKRLDKQHAGEGGIKAIGITGSDVYDKLSILQALRNKFPDRLFFTTDLDALLTQQTEIKWARNLIVASPFGLRLHDELQRNTPPFRDSYQTALYLTTLLALYCPHTEKHCSGDNLNEAIKKLQIKPRLFEIGNNEAIDLSHTPGKGIHPELKYAGNSKITHSISYINIFGGIASLIILSYLLTPRISHKYINIIALGTLSVVSFYMAIAILLEGDLGSEPLSFTSGASSWHASGIRILAFVFACCFLKHIYDQIKENNREIIKRYKPISVKTLKEKQDTPSTSFLYIDQWGKDFMKNEPIEFSSIWSIYFTNYLSKYRKHSYLLHIYRVLISLLVYLACIFLLLYFINDSFKLNLLTFPTRGEWNQYFTPKILYLTVGIYLALIFVIVDISHSSSHFVTLLKSHNVVWPKFLLRRYSKKYALPEQIVKKKILIDIILTNTKTINSFVYYPFIILFLLILSRNHYFDNWQVTKELIMIFSFTALIASASAYRLKRAAEETRKSVLKELEADYLLQLSRNAAWHKLDERSDKIKLLIEKHLYMIKLLIAEIKNLKEGPFLPLSQHPVVLSLLMPFSSVGGLYLLEYFSFSVS